MEICVVIGKRLLFLIHDIVVPEMNSLPNLFFSTKPTQSDVVLESSEEIFEPRICALEDQLKTKWKLVHDFVLPALVKQLDWWFTLPVSPGSRQGSSTPNFIKNDKCEADYGSVAIAYTREYCIMDLSTGDVHSISNSPSKPLVKRLGNKLFVLLTGI